MFGEGCFGLTPLAGSALTVSALSATGATSFECSMLAANSAMLGPSFFVRSFARLDFALPSLQYTMADFSMLVRQFARSGLPSSIRQGLRTGAELSAFDFAKVSSALPARSTTRAGSAALVLAFSHPGFSLSLHSWICMGPLMSISNAESAGSVLSVRGFACSGSTAFANGLFMELWLNGLGSSSHGLFAHGSNAFVAFSCVLGPFLLELQHHHDGPDLVSGAGTVLHRADPGRSTTWQLSSNSKLWTP
eukprot:s2445_g1.t1